MWSAACMRDCFCAFGARCIRSAVVSAIRRHLAKIERSSRLYMCLLINVRTIVHACLDRYTLLPFTLLERRRTGCVHPIQIKCCCRSQHTHTYTQGALFPASVWRAKKNPVSVYILVVGTRALRKASYNTSYH